jgi:hypothetical protein
MDCTQLSHTMDVTTTVQLESLDLTVTVGNILPTQWPFKHATAKGSERLNHLNSTTLAARINELSPLLHPFLDTMIKDGDAVDFMARQVIQ